MNGHTAYIASDPEIYQFDPWLTLTLDITWPCHLVYFSWLSQSYIVLKFRSIWPSRCLQLEILFETNLFDLDLDLWPWPWKFGHFWQTDISANMTDQISAKIDKLEKMTFFALIWPLWPWNCTSKVKLQKEHQRHVLRTISCILRCILTFLNFPPKIPQLYPLTDFAPWGLTTMKPSIFYLPLHKLRFGASFVKIGPVDVSN